VSCVCDSIDRIKRDPAWQQMTEEDKVRVAWIVGFNWAKAIIIRDLESQGKHLSAEEVRRVSVDGGTIH